MSDERFQTIDREQLVKRIERERPDNISRSGGYALVNVLGHEAFTEQHIPGSINIPMGDEADFEARFDKSKDIVVYCASTDCDASPTVAKRLAERGFENVYDYEAGIKDWVAAGHRVQEGGA